jgi:molybdate transport system permease protein
MVGGNIEGETRTIAISIYDRVQAFDNHSAGVMSAFLLLFSLVAIGFVYRLSYRRRRHDY